ncbi:cysteine proteinase [Pleomassaria siparia CBS 279.74]|uniref:Cysteine proteinase n=1 Tax=Pleomassaria siparia CBS 279.74 TaxID=1314801 RepID=A0A6G1KLL3_9PLEO|nr:cysteine proteinase [Pleomassaria siparia CBS 279.74]
MSSVAADDDTKAPQELLNEFWENLITKKPGKVTNIFPSSLYANLLPPIRNPGPSKGKNAAESYQVAANECRTRVKRIVRECQRTNEKFTDPEFDIEGDGGTKNCLQGLMNWYYDTSPSGTAGDPWKLGKALSTLVEVGLLATPSIDVDLAAASKALGFSESSGSSRGPKSVHRIDWIFDNPSFTVDGYSSSDVQQGQNGDCWFIAAVATICSNPNLMDKICVEKDEECGVYGFVFYRDGEWIWTVVDDNLYLDELDFDAYGDDYDPSGIKEKKHKKNYQTGSDALYFASCADQNETWLPLLEKAYAKVHGDYDSIAGGISGEGVEDLTGGVTSKVMTSRILSNDRLWNELLEVNKHFLFSASSPGTYGDDSNTRRGLALCHAYSIIKAVEEEDEEGNKHRLVLIRNPWGRRSWNGVGEWNGAWSDGSKEWTPYWMKKLDYRFGDDGLFWMSYDDIRKRFELLDRTRLFNEDWTVVQQWTSVSVAWVTGYLNTKFLVEIKKAGPTVFVLCQLDDRFFCGLKGKYRFDLHFLLKDENSTAGEHIVRARGAWFGNRSISAEVDLEPGKYEVLPKIVAQRSSKALEVHDVVRKLADRNPQKLRQIGMNYDIANAKGVIELTEEEKKKKETKAKEAKEAEEKEKTEFEQWKKEKKEQKEKEKKEQEEKEKKIKAKEEAEKEKTEFEQWKKDKKEQEEKERKDDPKTVTSTETAVASAKPGQTTKDKVSTTTQNAAKDELPQVGGNAEGPSSVYGDAAPQPAANAPAPAENKQNPWNAVCVLGLRVYSKDPEVSIKLVKPKNAEEAAVLATDGSMPAGATM